MFLKVFLVLKLLFEFPGGNLVDGLPPVAHNNATREKAGQERAKLFMATVSSFVTCSGSARSFAMRLQGNTEDIPRKIS